MCQFTTQGGKEQTHWELVAGKSTLLNKVDQHWRASEKQSTMIFNTRKKRKRNELTAVLTTLCEGRRRGNERCNAAKEHVATMAQCAVRVEESSLKEGDTKSRKKNDKRRNEPKKFGQLITRATVLCAENKRTRRFAIERAHCAKEQWKDTKR